MTLPITYFSFVAVLNGAMSALLAANDATPDFQKMECRQVLVSATDGAFGESCIRRAALSKVIPVNLEIPGFAPAQLDIMICFFAHGARELAHRF